MFEDLVKFLKWRPPEIPHIIQGGILPTQGKLVLAGEEETFKTMFAIYAGCTIACGNPLLGFKTSKCRVGMLQSELPKAMLHERLVQFMSHAPNAGFLAADIHFATELDIKLNRPNGLAQLVIDIKQFEPQLLILDPLYKILGADISNWDEMGKLCNNLDFIIHNYHCSIWLCHHIRKHHIMSDGIVDLGSDELVGSSILKNWADTIIRVTFIDKQQDILKFEFLKVRNAHRRIRPIAVRFNRDTMDFELEGLDISAEELTGE